jgi:competence protein ComEA
MLKKLLCIAMLFSSFTTWAAVEANKADGKSLQTIKGIGPSVAAKIIRERENGAFKDWSDMVNRVKGVGPATAGKLSQEGLTVNGVGYTSTQIAPTPIPQHSTMKKYPPPDRY